jgi:hypothetical protein
MKASNSYLLLLIIWIALLGACNKKVMNPEEGIVNAEPDLLVENKQRSLLVYLSNTENAMCGYLGGPNFKEAIKEKGTNEIIPLNVPSFLSRLTPYYKRESSINNQDSVFIPTLFSELYKALSFPYASQGGYRVPAFSVNNEYLGTVLGVNYKVSAGTIINRVNLHNFINPELGLVARKTIVGNTIKVEVKSKFYKSVQGDYYWSALVMEKTKVGRQNVDSTFYDYYEHNYVLRASMLGGKLDNQTVIGNAPFASGEIPFGTEFDKIFTLDYVDYPYINPDLNIIRWFFKPDNTVVAVIVWRKSGSRFNYVNGFLAK